MQPDTLLAYNQMTFWWILSILIFLVGMPIVVSWSNKKEREEKLRREQEEQPPKENP